MILHLDDAPGRCADVVSRVIDDEAVLVHPVQGKIRVINRVGAQVWEMADASRTLGEIAGVIALDYGIGLDQAQADVVAFCGDLVDRGLLVLNR